MGRYGLKYHDTGRAGFFREIRRLVAARQDGLQACVCQTGIGPIGFVRDGRTADRHAEAL